MAGAWGTRRRPAPAAVASALLAACLALAALTLLAPSSPSYDPFAWIVWGRELVGSGETFGVAGGPSWKPLPVLFTAVFAFTGGAAPALWLLVARTGAMLAVAGAFRLGERLAGRWAGALAALALLLLEAFVSLAWRGASEPLLLACILWGVERHLAGARRAAFALGVAAALIRPEVVPFLALYALLLWRDAGVRDRWLLAGGLAFVPLLWLGVPAIGGDALAASTTASSHAGGTHASAWTALRRGLALPLAPLWPLACLAALLRPRDRVVSGLLAAAAAWLALVVAMTVAGYAGVARYMLPAAALACVLGAVGAVELLARVSRSSVLAGAHGMTAGQDASPGRRSAFTALAIVIGTLGVAGLAVERAATLDDQVRDGIQVAHAHDDLRAAIEDAGGAAAMRRCALSGWVAINHTAQSALAWELRVGLDRVARTMSRPGLLVRAPRSEAAGAPAPIALPRPLRIVSLARAGAWDVLAVQSAAVSLPPACGGRKASGLPRRIPNI